MCGIAGFIDFAAKLSSPKQILFSMGEKISHRGPDDHGEWFDQQVGIGFSHRRLSILDLSKEGHQPMHSPRERYVIAYNGEVYNFKFIAEQLRTEGVSFHGHSDTEVIIAAIEQWGLDKALEQFNGMFAFALWDKKEKKLSLVRDRLGIKPLFYGFVQGMFLFSSELSPIKLVANKSLSIDKNSLACFLRYSYIPAPFSIYRSISKLLPGQVIELDYTTQQLAKRKYWSTQKIAIDGLHNKYKVTDQEAIALLDENLKQAVEKRMVADVPLGAFLSGGVDSSVVVALMQQLSKQPIKTFSIGFDEAKYDEAPHAKAVAQHLKTEHTELYVTPQQALDVIPKLPNLYDEPFADSSQIPTFLVSQLAKQHVTVSLSGDGGDELFAGYNRYFMAQDISRKLFCLPYWLRCCLGSTAASLPPALMNFFVVCVMPFLPKRYRNKQLADRLYKFAVAVREQDRYTLYNRLMSAWKQPGELLLGQIVEPEIFFSDSIIREGGSYLDYMTFTDLNNYLPDDILTKVDRASMGCSLEARVPLLDHQVVELAWKMPQEMKVRKGEGKWLLKQVLYQYVPKALIERPKMGFGVPIDEWLRGPLREWGEDLLSEKTLCAEGIFNVDKVRSVWGKHLNGQGRWHACLWPILMFEAWLREQ